MQDRSLSIANILAKMPKIARILNEFPAAVLIQERRVTSNTSEVNCPNWMMQESVIAFCEQYTKNAPQYNCTSLLEWCYYPGLILRNRLVLHVSVVVFILHHKLSHMIFNLVFINIFQI